MATVGLNLLFKIVYERRVDDFLKLNKEWFFGTEELKTFSFLEDYIKKYSVLPNPDLLPEMTSVELEPTPEPIGFYYDEYENRGIHNEMSATLPKVIELLNKERSPSKALNNIQDLCKKTDRLLSRTKFELSTMQALGSSVLSFVENARTVNGLIGIPTGWNTLDKQTNGLQGGDITAIVARPKMGKTLALMFMSSAAHANGKIPLLISMEMKSLQFAKRYYAMKSSIPMDFIKSGQLSTLSEMKLRDTSETLKNLPPFYFIEGQFKKDIKDISSLIYGLKPDIVYIDAGYLIRITGRERLSKWEHMTEIAEELKSIAIVNNIPIVVSFQVNREGSRYKAEMDQIHLSDAIAQISSLVAGIFEDKKSELISRYRRIEILGGREGESGNFYIHWDWDRMNFTEIERGINENL